MNQETEFNESWTSLISEINRRNIDVSHTDFGATINIRFANSDYDGSLIVIENFVVWGIHIILADDDFAKKCPPLLNSINAIIPIGCFQVETDGRIEFRFSMNYFNYNVKTDELDALLTWISYIVDRFSKVIYSCASNLVEIEDAIRKISSDMNH